MSVHARRLASALLRLLAWGLAGAALLAGAFGSWAGAWLLAGCVPCGCLAVLASPVCDDDGEGARA